MPTLAGIISIAGLPPHRGLIVNLCLYRVRGPGAPPPYGGDPPASAAVDEHKVAEDVHLNEESLQTVFEQRFSIKHAPGYYYAAVRAILLRERAGSVFAQVEQFFFGRQVFRIAAEPEGAVALPVAWPAKALEDLTYYGTISAQGTDSH